MALGEVLEGTIRLISVIGDCIDELPVERNDKNLAAAGCLHLALEHHGAIALLVKEFHRGSASALVRPQLEAFLRGAWLHRCATELAATAFLNDKDPPSQKDMIKALEKHDFFKNGALSLLRDKLWNGLCSYTHAGGLHVTRRISATEFVQNYSDDELIEMLGVSNLVALMTAAEILDIAPNDDAFGPIYAAYTEIQKCP